MSEGTKWTASGQSIDVRVLDENGAVVALVYSGRGEGQDLDSRRHLIAAAWDLYRAASLAHAYFASHSNGENEASEHFKRIGAALARARGETP